MNRHPLRRLFRHVAHARALTLAALLIAALPFADAALAAPAASVATTPVTTAPAPSAVATAVSPATSTTPTTPLAVPAAVPTGAPPATNAAAAATPATASGTRSLDEQIQDLKRQTIELNRDLFVLEEDLLFPANTQVAVFVSVDVGDFFALDSIDLKIDNKEVSNYLYTPREVAALLRGGVQRLYVGNLKAGPHELVAFFNGKGPKERYYRRAASLRFEKGLGAKYLELKVTDHQHAQQPEFEIKDWQ